MMIGNISQGDLIELLGEWTGAHGKVFLKRARQMGILLERRRPVLPTEIEADQAPSATLAAGVEACKLQIRVKRLVIPAISFEGRGEILERVQIHLMQAVTLECAPGQIFVQKTGQ